MMTTCDYRPGLEGVPATQSSISYVDGKAGILEYRGIRIGEIAQHSSFLETAYLLIWGGLPTQQELQDFEHRSSVSSPAQISHSRHDEVLS